MSKQSYPKTGEDDALFVPSASGNYGDNTQLYPNQANREANEAARHLSPGSTPLNDGPELNGNFFSTLHRFEQVAALNPNNTCLVHGERRLLYHEVNAMANHLARHLLQSGVQPQQLMPILLQNSFDLVIAVLATWKAGAAYVPVNPAYPADRVSFILKDIGADLLITNQTNSKLVSGLGINTIIDTGDFISSNVTAVENQMTKIEPGQLAYVMFTSGSTGKPKGVMIEHGALLNYLVNTETQYVSKTGQLAGSFVFLSPTFDASITALFMPLLAGKFSVITTRSDGEVFEDINLAKYAPFDFLKVTPSHLEFLASTIEKGKPWLTKKLVIGGEALHANQLSCFAENDIDIEIINEYGPTEATVGCCTFNLKSTERSKFKTDIPIGSAIQNMQVYLFDDATGKLEPANEGEIYIGGPGLARGYLNNDALTRDRFIDNPIVNSPFRTLYKTGDLARRLKDGTLVYTGRNDSQVKVGGIRIETGEIEAIIGSLQYVQNTCVQAVENGDTKKLVCFVQLNVLECYKLFKDQVTFDDKGIELAPEVEKLVSGYLRNHLEQLLPAYMIPSRFICFNSFPLTAHGKTDRKKLLASLKPIEAKRAGTLPNTLTEKELEKIWCRILSLQQIGTDQNFFQLGGNSIQAAQLFNLIRKSFKQNLPLSTLLKAPTIQKLAAAIDSKEDNTVWGTLFPFRKKGSKPPLFLVHGGAGNILFYQELANALDKEQPVYGIIARGLDGRQVPHTSVEEMAAFYVDNIIKIQPSGPYFLAGYCFGAIVCFEMAHQLANMGKKVDLLLNINGVSPVYRPLKQPVNGDRGSNRQSLKQRFMQHQQQFSQLTTFQKCLYPLKKLKAKTGRTLRKYRFKLTVYKAVQLNRLLKKIYSYYLSRNQPIPPRLVNGFYFNTNAEMARNYQPKKIATKVVIFRSPRIFTEPMLGWKDFAEGPVEIVDIPGQHANRRVVLHAPFVSFLAEKMQYYMDVVNE